MCANKPGLGIQSDLHNEIADAVGGRVVSSNDVGEFAVGGFLDGGYQSQSDIALTFNVHRGIKCCEESGFREGLRIMSTTH